MAIKKYSKRDLKIISSVLSVYASQGFFSRIGLFFLALNCPVYPSHTFSYLSGHSLANSFIQGFYTRSFYPFVLFSIFLSLIGCLVFPHHSIFWYLFFIVLVLSVMAFSLSVYLSRKAFGFLSVMIRDEDNYERIHSFINNHSLSMARHEDSCVRYALSAFVNLNWSSLDPIRIIMIVEGIVRYVDPESRDLRDAIISSGLK